MVKRLRPGNIRVSRVTRAVEGAHAISVERVVCQSWIRIGSDVWPLPNDLHKVGAIIPCAAFDQKTGPRLLNYPSTPGLSDLRKLPSPLSYSARLARLAESALVLEWCRCWSRRRSWSWCRRWSWRPATTWELERADTCPPGKTGRGRVILRGVPESAIVHRIDCHVAVIAPTAVGAGLAAGTGKQCDFSLRQSVYGIAYQSAGVANLRIDSAAGGAVTDSDISLWSMAALPIQRWVVSG